EVVGRLDLLLEVEVLLVEAGSFPLRQDAVGDVDAEGTGGPDGPVRAAARLHPHFDPCGAAGLATQFQFPPGGRRTRHLLAPPVVSAPKEGVRDPTISSRGRPSNSAARRLAWRTRPSVPTSQ